MNSAIIALATLSLLTGCATFSSGHHTQDPKQSEQAFEVLKSLAGNWEGTMGEGKSGSTPVKVSYELVSAGSAVMERLASGSDHEMITMYHRDGPGLLMTHYCAMGNQPRMELVGFSEKPEATLNFDYLDATNLASPKQMVMHNMRLSMIDKNHFASSWTAFVDGKPNHTGDFTFSRVRSLGY